MVSLLALPVSVMYFAFGIFSTVIAVQHYKKPELRECSINDFLMACIYFFCCGAFPFMYGNTGISAGWEDTFFLLADVILYGFLVFLMGYIIREVLRARKNPALKEERSYKRLLEKNAGFAMDNKRDMLRKLLHLIPVGVILIIHFMSIIIAPGLPADLTPKGFAYFAIVTIGYAFVAMFMLAETLRLINYNKLFWLTPDWAHKWFASSLKETESQSLISSIPVVLCLMPFLFGPFTVFVTVALVESLADATASLVGKRFGRHKIPACPLKSWEGLIAGCVVAFGMTLLGFVLVPWDAVSWVQVLVLGVGNALVFAAIDVFSRRIMDNILNPLLVGAFMVLFLALLKVI
ncbi:MAG: phosphatidate cytidylyltransferase [Candidatus Lokiarchaeota archaeon]|nr:phosphatidate cytidylyltransferase [Candidatus Lokiarchaeota archaeon]